jgi:cysteinyl-tRNA synthetase
MEIKSQKFIKPIILLFIFIIFNGYSVLAKSVKNWICVYKKHSIVSFLRNRADLLIIDPDDYTKKEISFLTRKKQVLAYLSVGEAEEYRKYFSTLNKEIIVKENEEWKGNFPIKFWHEDWKKTLFKYAEEIAEKGFDGFSLDVVDVWEAYENKQLYKEKMAQLLIELSDHIQKKFPERIFLIHNSHQLFEFEEIMLRYTGILQEGLYETWMKEKPDQWWLEEKFQALSRLQKAGKFIALLEYTRDKTKMRQIKEAAKALGFFPSFSVKELDKIFYD